MYLAEMLIGDGASFKRDNKNNFYVAAGLSVVLQFVNNPILSLFGINVV